MLIPLVNIIIFLKIAKVPLWWIIPLLIPVIQIIFWCSVSYSFVRKFGDKSLLTIIAFMLVNFLYIPLLAFDKEAVYKE